MNLIVLAEIFELIVISVMCISYHSLSSDQVIRIMIGVLMLNMWIRNTSKYNR